jgi:hypothetical protein
VSANTFGLSGRLGKFEATGQKPDRFWLEHFFETNIPISG